SAPGTKERASRMTGARKSCRRPDPLGARHLLRLDTGTERAIVTVIADDSDDVGLGLRIRRDAPAAYHRLLTRVVRPDRELEIAVEQVRQDPQVTHTTEDVLARIERIGDHHALRGFGNELHQAVCVFGRNRARIVTALDLDHRTHELLWDLVKHGSLPDVSIV